MKTTFLDRKRCDMLTLNREQEKKLRSKMKSDQIASSCFGLIIGIVAVLFWMLIAGVAWHFIIEAYKSHPYLIWSIGGIVGSSITAIVLWAVMARVSRKEIKLPSHLIAVDPDKIEG